MGEAESGKGIAKETERTPQREGERVRNIESERAGERERACVRESLSSEFARLRESFTLKMHSRLPNVTVQMLLYLYVNLRLMNKLHA